MFFERRCPGCQRRARFVCDRCFSDFGASGPVSLEGLDRVFASYDYDDGVARTILAAKNRGRRDVLRRLGQIMAREQPQARWLGRVDVVTWVPASPQNRRQRGFDQGRLLAQAVAARHCIPVQRLLVRRGRQQTGQGRQARLEGVALWSVRPAPGRILVVDDVVTTGASLQRAAAVLSLAGASSVSAMTIASTGWPAPSR